MIFLQLNDLKALWYTMHLRGMYSRKNADLPVRFHLKNNFIK